MVVKREATPEDASSFLSEVFQQTDNHLNMFQSLQTFAQGIASQQGKPTCRSLKHLRTQMEAYV